MFIFNGDSPFHLIPFTIIFLMLRGPAVFFSVPTPVRYQNLPSM